MNPTKPTSHIPEAAQEVLDRLRAGAEMLLRQCGRCLEHNRIVRGADRDPPVPSEFVLVRDCKCIVGDQWSPLTEDAVVSHVLGAIAPREPAVQIRSPQFRGPPTPIPWHEAVGHLYFDVDSVSCSVCGGSEPFTFKARAPFKTVMRTLDAIVALHPETPHPYRASL